MIHFFNVNGPGTHVHAESARQELVRALSIRAACTLEIELCLGPPKIKITSLYFSRKVTNPERLYGVKIMKIRAFENLTLGPLYHPLRRKNI